MTENQALAFEKGSVWRVARGPRVFKKNSRVFTKLFGRLIVKVTGSRRGLHDPTMFFVKFETLDGVYEGVTPDESFLVPCATLEQLAAAGLEES